MSPGYTQGTYPVNTQGTHREIPSSRSYLPGPYRRIYTWLMQHTRNHKQITITIPPNEHKAALKKLPYGEARTFSSLVRLALSLLPRKK